MILSRILISIGALGTFVCVKKILKKVKEGNKTLEYKIYENFVIINGTRIRLRDYSFESPYKLKILNTIVDAFGYDLDVFSSDEGEKGCNTFLLNGSVYHYPLKGKIQDIIIKMVGDCINEFKKEPSASGSINIGRKGLKTRTEER